MNNTKDRKAKVMPVESVSIYSQLLTELEEFEATRAAEEHQSQLTVEQVTTRVDVEHIDRASPATDVLIASAQATESLQLRAANLVAIALTLGVADAVQAKIEATQATKQAAYQPVRREISIFQRAAQALRRKKPVSPVAIDEDFVMV